MDDLSPKQRRIREAIIAYDAISEREPVKIQVMANRSTNRTVDSEFYVTKSEASLKLTKTQEQAREDIAIGKYYQENGGCFALIGYRTVNLLSVGGGSKQDLEKLYAYMKKMMGQYNGWCFSLAADRKYSQIDVVEWMCEPGATLKALHHRSGVREASLSKWFKEGLDRYDELFYRGKK